MHLENLAQVRVIAMDKTGTLTRGRPEVTAVVALNGPEESEVLALAAALELRSQHPLARAIMDKAATLGLVATPADDFRSLTGSGATGRVGGATHWIGSPALFDEQGIDLTAPRSRIEALQSAGNTVVVVGSSQAAFGLIAIAGAVAGALSLPLAVIAHEASEFLVIAGGLRMLKA